MGTNQPNVSVKSPHRAPFATLPQQNKFANALWCLLRQIQLGNIVQLRREICCRKHYLGHMGWMTPPNLTEEWVTEFGITHESHGDCKVRNHLLRLWPRNQTWTGASLLINPEYHLKGLEEAMWRLIRCTGLIYLCTLYKSGTKCGGKS